MLEYLSIIFGSNVGPIYLGGFANPVLQDIFAKFNIAILSVALLVMTYTSMVSTVNTAQDGQILGKKWSSVWLPIRSLLGLVIMVPIPGSGYTMVQSFALWFIIQAGNVADQTWELVVDYLEQGVSVSKAIELDPASKAELLRQGEALTLQMINSAICMHSIQQIANRQALDASAEPIPASEFIAKYGKNLAASKSKVSSSATHANTAEYIGYFNIGSKKTTPPAATPPEYAQICGRYKVVAKVNATELGDSAELFAKLAHDVAQQKLYALDAIWALVRRLADKISNDKSDPNLPNSGINIHAYRKEGGKIYLNMLSNLVNLSKMPTANIMQSKLRATSWTSIGALYLNLDETREVKLLNTVLQDRILPTTLPINEVASVPSCNYVELQQTDHKDLPQLGYLGKYISTRDEVEFICKKLAYTNAELGPQQINHPHPAPSENTRLQNAGHEQLLADAMLKLSKETSSRSVGNPIVAQFHFGKTLLQIAEAKLSQPEVPFNLLTVVPIALWLCGAILVFFVPLIPCVIYTTAVIGWFVLVIENFFILPIMAIGLILPSRDEIGRVAQNLALPINTIIRPVLMVINFILAIRIYKIAVELINSIMVSTVITNFENVSVLSPIITIICYVVLILIAANICFSLPYKIPNQLTLAVQKSLEQQELYVHNEQQGKNTNAQQSSTNQVQAQMANVVAGALAPSNSKNIDVVKDPSGLSK